MKTLMIYPEFPDTFWSFKHALKFINKKAASPPLGLITIAAMLPEDWQLRLLDLNISKIKKKDIIWADIILISAMNIQKKSTIEVIKNCKSLGKTIVAGGPLFTGEFEQFPDVDHFVLNEAEITLPVFLKDWENGQPKRIYQTEEFADITKTPAPRWDLIQMDQYDSLPIQFTRGCPHNCDFCNITALLGHKVRIKTVNQIISELELMVQAGWQRNVFFVDDNFIGNRKFIKENLLPAIIEWKKDKKGLDFTTEATITLSDDEELMEQMVKAGFKSVFIGIETPETNSLEECNKKQNLNRNLVDSVKKIQRFGMQVSGGFIVGFDNDQPSIFKKQIEFIQNSGIVTAMVGLLQAPHGTKLYDRLLKEDRLLQEMSGDNTDGTTNIIPAMDIRILHKGYQEILSTIYSPVYFYERVKTFLKEYEPRHQNVHLQINEVMALFRSIIRIGILSADRKHYWDLFFWSLKNFPKKFPMAITFSIYGFHFRKISQLNNLFA
ncbi:MAG: B12-binding domain-containing radical SAM protein [Anaerolineaceae bacterium]|nr:B12-binding domain-containing radical SAM protein [Anaerolineaceae bacterium]